MTALTLPANGVRDIRWRLQDDNQLVRSEVTGETKVLLQRRARWSAQIDIAIADQADFLAWAVFMSGLEGRANTFLLPATKAGEQTNIVVATVTSDTGSNGPEFVTTGWGTASPTLVMKAGQRIDLAGRLYVLQSDVTTGAGANNDHALMVIRPRLAATTAAGTVRVRAPMGVMRLAEDAVGWADMLSNWQPFSLQCEEAW